MTGLATAPILREPSPEQRYVGWFHELDAWTEYWDIFHPETRGRFYFGDGSTEPGLLTRYLPRERRPPVFVAWTRMALRSGDAESFAKAVRNPEVAPAVIEVENLLAELFARHFGDAAGPFTQLDYLEATLRCAMDTLPPAAGREALIPKDDWRRPTAGRHMIDSDLMWFAWALHLEAADLLIGRDRGHARRALQLAGVAAGCPANFAWRGHRRTRPEYHPDRATIRMLKERGLHWASDFEAAAREVHALYRIREWGQPE